MRPGRLLSTAAGILSLAAASKIAVAQQQPIHGCNAAASCRPLGYSTLDKSSGLGGSFFFLGARFGPGFEIVLPTPVASPAAQGREPAPSPTPRADVFHLGVSLLPPTPNPTPPPTPSPAAPRAKR